MSLRPCLGLPGQPCTNNTRNSRGRCGSCEKLYQRARNQKPERRALYGGNWQRRSRAARLRQPWCSICGGTLNLSLDHEHDQVECIRCNSSHRRNPA